MHQLDSLTAGQLDLAAGDLYNAAQVVHHAGHGRHALVRRDGGAVCALGAIEAATYKRLANIDHIFLLLTTEKDYDAGLYRAQNASLVFAEVLPNALCAECDWEDRERHSRVCPTGTCYAPEPEAKITHYNDYHCPGGEVLETLFTVAAQRATDRANARRTMLTGRELVTA